MLDRGTVIHTENGFAKVAVKRREECSRCGMCAFSKNADEIVFNCKNDAGAKEGDVVTVEKAKEGKLLAVLLVFLVPLLLIGLAALINALLIKWDMSVVIMSVLFIILWYTILAAIDKKISVGGKMSPVIKEIVNKE